MTRQQLAEKLVEITRDLQALTGATDQDMVDVIADVFITHLTLTITNNYQEHVHTAMYDDLLRSIFESYRGTRDVNLKTAKEAMHKAVLDEIAKAMPVAGNA